MIPLPLSKVLLIHFYGFQYLRTGYLRFSNLDLGTTVKTAYGPYGMNKIVQNHIEKLFLTSDAATMIRELDIKHPAAKMVVMAAHQQEEEAGDGTNGVVILCSAILAEAEYLLRMGLSVPEVVSGLKTALSYAQEQLESLTIHSGKVFNK